MLISEFYGCWYVDCITFGQRLAVLPSFQSLCCWLTASSTLPTWEWEWCQSSHLTLDRKANKCISQNVELFHKPNWFVLRVRSCRQLQHTLKHATVCAADFGMWGNSSSPRKYFCHHKTYREKKTWNERERRLKDNSCKSICQMQTACLGPDHRIHPLQSSWQFCLISSKQAAILNMLVFFAY